MKKVKLDPYWLETTARDELDTDADYTVKYLKDSGFITTDIDFLDLNRYLSNPVKGYKIWDGDTIRPWTVLYKLVYDVFNEHSRRHLHVTDFDVWDSDHYATALLLYYVDNLRWEEVNGKLVMMFERDGKYYADGIMIL